MAFYREFLKQEGEDFEERDEAALVLFLLEARLNQSAVNLEMPAGFVAPDALTGELASAGAKKQLKFVAGFLCFFVAKPMGYVRDMRAFKRYFIPGFADDRAKQIQLGQALKAEFFNANLEDLERMESLDWLMDTEAFTPRPVFAAR